jgi:hypothetical protein
MESTEKDEEDEEEDEEDEEDEDETGFKENIDKNLLDLIKEYEDRDKDNWESSLKVGDIDENGRRVVRKKIKKPTINSVKKKKEICDKLASYNENSTKKIKKKVYKRSIIQMYKFELIPEDIAVILLNWYSRRIPISGMVKQINPRLATLGLSPITIIDMYMYMFYLSKITKGFTVSTRNNKSYKIGITPEIDEKVIDDRRMSIFYEYTLKQFASFYKAWRYGFTCEECHICAQLKETKKGSKAHAKRIFTGLQIKSRKMRDRFGKSMFRPNDVIIGKLLESMRLICIGRTTVNAYVIFFNELSQEIRLEIAKRFPGFSDKMLFPERDKVRRGLMSVEALDELFVGSDIDIKKIRYLPDTNFIKTQYSPEGMILLQNTKPDERAQELLKTSVLKTTSEEELEDLQPLPFDPFIGTISGQALMMSEEEEKAYKDRLRELVHRKISEDSEEEYNEIRKKVVKSKINKAESTDSVHEQDADMPDTYELDIEKEIEIQREAALKEAQRIESVTGGSELLKDTNKETKDNDRDDESKDEESKDEESIIKEKIIEMEQGIPLSDKLKQRLSKMRTNK